GTKPYRSEASAHDLHRSARSELAGESGRGFRVAEGISEHVCGVWGEGGGAGKAAAAGAEIFHGVSGSHHVWDGRGTLAGDVPELFPVARDGRRILSLLGLSGERAMGDLRAGTAGPDFEKGVSRERGEDFCAIPGGAAVSTNFGRSAILFLAGALAFAAGCKKSETTAEKPLPASSVTVQAGENEIRVVTKAAEFRLGRSGDLQGALREGNTTRTFEEKGPGIRVRTEAGEVADFARALAHAQVAEASGKLGAAGKRVSVRGQSPSTGLEEVLTIEVYDDFPSLALVSASYQNKGDNAVKLEDVVLGSQRLNASLADPNAKPNEMYALFGSSLKWGKDDLGSGGGGILVVACWRRATGVAIGHLETLLLPVSIPTATTADGRVEAGVRIPAEATLNKGESFGTPR